MNGSVECLQKLRDCQRYSSGKCLCLMDTDFGKRTCPFYKTEADTEKQLKEAEKARLDIAIDKIYRRKVWDTRS